MRRCATAVDEEGIVVDHAWGDCLEGCPGTRQFLVTPVRTAHELRVVKDLDEALSIQGKKKEKQEKNFIWGIKVSFLTVI